MNFKNPKKTKFFWAYIVAGILLVVLAILFAPIWTNFGDWCFWKSWGTKIINLIIAAVLIAYLFGYLLKKVIHSGKGTTKILTIVEFVLLSLVALGCILSQFKVINVNGACKIFGLALWCRGVVEAVRGYFYRHNPESKVKYPLWYFCLVIAMITFGTYAFAKPFFTDTQLLWVFVVCMILAGVLFIVYGCMTKPKGTKKAKEAKTKKETK